MEFIVSNEEIEGTKTFKKVEKMFQNMLLKLSNRRTISQGLISFRLTGVIPGSIAGNNLRVLKDLIELEKQPTS